MAITFVQQTPNNHGSATTLVLTFSGNATVGNWVLIFVDCGSATGAVTSITGVGVTAGGTNLLDSGSQTGGFNRCQIYAVQVATAGTTITINSAGGTTLAATAVEFSGLATPLVTDQTNTNRSTTITKTSPALSIGTTNANDLIIAIGTVSNSKVFSDPTSPWNALNGLSGTAPSMGAVYQIVSSTNTFTPSFTTTATALWAVGVMGLQAAPGGPPRFRHKPIKRLKPTPPWRPKPTLTIAADTGRKSVSPGKVPIKVVKDPRPKHFKYPPFKNSRTTTVQDRARLSPRSGPLFFSGFEIGSTAEWLSATIGTGDTISVQSTTVNPNGGGFALETISTTIPEIFLAYGLGSQPTCYTRMYINIASIAASIPATGLVITEYDTNISGVGGFIGIVTDGSGNPSLQLYYYPNGSVIPTQVGSNYPISLNTWYCVEHKLSMSTTSGISEMRVNTQVVASAIGISTNPGSIVIAAIEQFDYIGTTTTNATIYFDDIFIGTLGYPGYGVSIARQGIAGTPTYDQWTKNGAATSALCWSTTPFSTAQNCTGTANQAQTMLTGSFSSSGSGVQGPGIIPSNATINGCKTGIVGKYTTPGTTFYIRRILNGIVNDTPIQLGSTDNWYDDAESYLNPSATLVVGSGPWISSLTYLNGAQVGATLLNTEAAQVEDAWLLVDYTIPPSSSLKSLRKRLQPKPSTVVRRVNKFDARSLSRPTSFVLKIVKDSRRLITKTVAVKNTKSPLSRFKNKIQPASANLGIVLHVIHKTRRVITKPSRPALRIFRMHLLRLIQPPSASLGLILKIVKDPRRTKSAGPSKLNTSRLRRVLKGISPFSVPLRLVHRPRSAKLGSKSTLKRRFSMKLLRLIQPPSSSLGILLKIIKDPRRLTTGSSGKSNISRFRRIFKALNPIGIPLRVVHRARTYKLKFGGPQHRRFPMRLLHLIQPPSASLGVWLRLIKHPRKVRLSLGPPNKRVFILKFLRLAGRPSVASVGVWMRIVKHPRAIKFLPSKGPNKVSLFKKLRNKITLPSGFRLKLVKDSRALKLTTVNIKLGKLLLKKLNNKIQPPASNLAPLLRLVKDPRALKLTTTRIKLGKILTKRLRNKITLPSGIWLRLVKDSRLLRFQLTKGSHGTSLFKRLHNKIQPPSSNLGILLKIIKDPRRLPIPFKIRASAHRKKRISTLAFKQTAFFIKHKKIVRPVTPSIHLGRRVKGIARLSGNALNLTAFMKLRKHRSMAKPVIIQKPKAHRSRVILLSIELLQVFIRASLSLSTNIQKNINKLIITNPIIMSANVSPYKIYRKILDLIMALITYLGLVMPITPETVNLIMPLTPEDDLIMPIVGGQDLDLVMPLIAQTVNLTMPLLP